MENQKPISELLEFSILNIDKPSGPTSFQVDDFVKKSLGLRKTSHFGTLDPKVTGVLPIALNRACKLSGFFMRKDKTYVGIMKMHKDIKLEILQKIIDENFTGKIKQIPPKRSKVKRQEREREIKKFELLEKQGKDILFLAEVEAGTYIRKLVHDLGLKIGGAHMIELRRIKAGIFLEENKEFPFINLYEFEKAVSEYKKGKEEKLKKLLIPAEEAIKKILPEVQVKEENLKHLLTGKPLMKQDLFDEEKLPDERFAVFFDEKFIGVYEKSEKKSGEKDKDIIAKPKFVYN